MYDCTLRQKYIVVPILSEVRDWYGQPRGEQGNDCNYNHNVTNNRRIRSVLQLIIIKRKCETYEQKIRSLFIVLCL